MHSSCWWGFSPWQQTRASLKRAPLKCARCGKWLFMSSTELVLLWCTVPRCSRHSLPLSLTWALAEVLDKEVKLISNSFHLSSLTAFFHLLCSCVKSQLLHGMFSLLSFLSLSETDWQMFASLLIFTLKNYITLVLIWVMQTENINKKLRIMTENKKNSCIHFSFSSCCFFFPSFEKSEVEKREKKPK